MHAITRTVYPLKSWLTFMPAHSLNFWGGLTSWVALRHLRTDTMVSFLGGIFRSKGWHYSKLNISYHPNRPIIPEWPKKLLNVCTLQLILWLIIANRPNANLHSQFCLVLQKKLGNSMPSDRVRFVTTYGPCMRTVRTVNITWSVLAVDRRSRTREQKITRGRSPFT